jgi:hypothetical protein
MLAYDEVQGWGRDGLGAQVLACDEVRRSDERSVWESGRDGVQG